MTIDVEKIEPFVIIPRYVVDDLRDGKITYREYELYVWVRLQANPYGITTISTDSILADLPHFRSTDWVSKTFRSLRSKKYLYYKERQGHRGSFRVEFDDWITPNKKIKRIDHLFNEDKLRSESTGKTDKSSEVNLDNTSATPKLDELKIELKPTNKTEGSTSEVRSPHTDTETQKDIETQRIVGNQKAFKKVVTRRFVPSNDQEERCWKIALELEDEHMDFILSVLKKHGLGVVNDAYNMYLDLKNDNERQGKAIQSPPKLFNWCVQTTIDSNNALEEERRTFNDDSIGRE